MIHFCFCDCHVFQFYCGNTYCSWQKYHHQHWRIELVFWIESSRLLNHYGLLRAILIRHGSRLLLNSVQSQEKEMDKWDTGWPKNVKLELCPQRPVSTRTSQTQVFCSPSVHSFRLALTCLRLLFQSFPLPLPQPRNVRQFLQYHLWATGLTFESGGISAFTLSQQLKLKSIPQGQYRYSHFACANCQKECLKVSESMMARLVKLWPQQTHFDVSLLL